MQLLKAAGGARVVMVSSALANSARLSDAGLQDVGGEALSESSVATYNLSKLYDALWAVELEKRYKAINVSGWAVHPGAVDTAILAKADPANWVVHIFRAVMRLGFAANVHDGALSALYAATAADVQQPGRTFGPNDANVGFCLPWRIHNSAYTPDNAAILFDATLKLIAAKGGVIDKV